MSYDSAFDLVKRKRACVKPNSGFVRYVSWSFFYVLKAPLGLIEMLRDPVYVCMCVLFVHSRGICV